MPPAVLPVNRELKCCEGNLGAGLHRRLPKRLPEIAVNLVACML